jgi:hypothetical protein
MLGLTLLLAGIFGLTTPWHESLPLELLDMSALGQQLACR